MNAWKKRKICELGRVVTGSTPPTAQPKYYNGKFRFITPSDLTYDTFIIDKTERTLSSTAHEKFSTRFVPANSVVYTCIASIGKIGLTREEALTNQQINSIVPNEKNDSLFLYYLLRYLTPSIDKYKSGAAVPIINKEIFENIEVSVSELATQKAIAAILSDYDSAIANARKQIELLEEAAMRLYREWFVDSANPKWVEGSVGDFAELLNGYAFKSKEFCSAGKYKIITIKNVKDGLFDVNKADAIDELPKSMPLHCKIQNGDILISLTGNVGRTCLTYGDGYLLNQRVAKIKSAFPSYAYCAFRSPTLQQIMLGLATGAAQQNLSPIKLCAAKWVIPDKIVLNNFEHRTRGMFSRIIVLLNTIQALTEARDRLLPKLMSGEVEI